MVAGDRYKVPRVYSYQSAPLGGRRDAEGRKEGQCPAQEDASRKVVGSNLGASNIFITKSPLKTAYIPLLWRFYII